MPQQSMMGSDTEMDTLYSDTSQGTTATEETQTIDQENEVEPTTSLVPVKVLAGSSGKPVKEGDTFTVKVVALHGDEAEIAYSGGKPSMGEGYEAEIDELDED